MGSNSHGRKTQIAVFGAGGFIGSHAVPALAKAGYHVLAIDKELDKLDDVPGEYFTAIDMDITTQRDEVRRIVQEADMVIDLIAYANPSLYVADPLGTVELNLYENLRIADLCVEFDKFLIQYSTCEVYGLDFGRNQPFSEETSHLILGPINEQRWIYSCAKQMLERIIFAYGERKGLNYIIVRPFNFVGPKVDYLVQSEEDGNPRVFSHFMSALLLGKPLPLVDGGHNLRSYTYIDDATDALMRIVENHEQLNRQIVNIGNPDNELSIRELAHLMIRLYEEETGSKFTAGTVDIPNEEFYGQGYADCDRRIPDSTKLSALNWQPKVDLETGFRKTIRYYMENNELVSTSKISPA